MLVSTIDVQRTMWYMCYLYACMAAAEQQQQHSGSVLAGLSQKVTLLAVHQQQHRRTDTKAAA
jgi:hypothetical protein